MPGGSMPGFVTSLSPAERIWALNPDTEPEAGALAALVARERLVGMEWCGGTISILKGTTRSAVGEDCIGNGLRRGPSLSDWRNS